MTGRPLAVPPPLLPCGTPRDDLLAQVGDGHSHDLTDHQHDCPHCQQALQYYQRLWAPFDQLAAQPVQAPGGMAARAVAWIRSTYDTTTSPVLPILGLPPGLPGTATVTTRVIIRSARLAAEGVDGVRVALSELSTHTAAADTAAADTAAADTAAADVAVAGTISNGHRARTAADDDVRAPLAVALTIATDYGHDLTVLAGRVRDAVDDVVRSLTGAAPDTVDVHIDDVLPA